MKATRTCSRSLRGKLDEHRDMWTQHSLHAYVTESVARHAIDCSLCKIPTVNLRPEREFAVLPVYTEGTNLTSGHGNHDDNNRSLWIVDR